MNKQTLAAVAAAALATGASAQNNQPLPVKINGIAQNAVRLKEHDQNPPVDLRLKAVVRSVAGWTAPASSIRAPFYIQNTVAADAKAFKAAEAELKTPVGENFLQERAIKELAHRVIGTSLLAMPNIVNMVVTTEGYTAGQSTISDNPKIKGHAENSSINSEVAPLSRQELTQALFLSKIQYDALMLAKYRPDILRVQDYAAFFQASQILDTQKVGAASPPQLLKRRSQIALPKMIESSAYDIGKSSLGMDGIQLKKSSGPSHP